MDRTVREAVIDLADFVANREAAIAADVASLGYVADAISVRETVAFDGTLLEEISVQQRLDCRSRHAGPQGSLSNYLTRSVIQSRSTSSLEQLASRLINGDFIPEAIPLNLDTQESITSRPCPVLRWR